MTLKALWREPSGCHVPPPVSPNVSAIDQVADALQAEAPKVAMTSAPAVGVIVPEPSDPALDAPGVVTAARELMASAIGPYW